MHFTEPTAEGTDAAPAVSAGGAGARPLVIGAFEVVLACLVSGLIGGKLAVRMLQDASWDLLNYHWYNPWALLNGRLGWDLAPAMRQTFFNPLLDVPFYLLVTQTSPKLGSAVLGAFQLLLVAGTYLLARLLLRPVPWPGWVKVATAAALAGAGLISPLMLYELGLTAGDNTSGEAVAEQAEGVERAGGKESQSVAGGVAVDQPPDQVHGRLGGSEQDQRGPEPQNAQGQPAAARRAGRGVVRLVRIRRPGRRVRRHGGMGEVLRLGVLRPGRRLGGGGHGLRVYRRACC